MDVSNALHSKSSVSTESFRETLESLDTTHPSFDSDYKVRVDGIPQRSFIIGSILLLFLLFGRVLSVLSFLFLPTGWFLMVSTLVISLEYWLYEPPTPNLGVVCARPMTKLQDNISSALVHFSLYEPPWWYMGTHSTTLLPVILNKPLPPKKMITQPIPAIDGSTLFLEWYVPESVSELRGVILAIAGMNGSSDGGYMVELMNQMGKQGYAVAVLTGRGAGKSKIETIESAFHLGRSDDLMCALEGVEKAINGHKLRVYILGFSAGGVRALKFASVYGECLVGRVTAILCFGGAVRNEKTHSMNLSKYVYQPVMVHAYACTLYGKLLPLLDTPQGQKVKEIFTTRGFESFIDYDKAVTAQLHKMTVEQYHAASMTIAKGLSEHISVPTLIVHACDDPVVHVEDSIVPEMAMGNSFITMLTTSKGGHIGWPTPEGGYKWMTDVASTYISQLEKSI